MDMFRMPHGQTFGYLSTQAALTDWLVRHQGVERSDVNSRVRLAATLEQSGWRNERRWVCLDRRLRSALLARWAPDQMTRANCFGATVQVNCVVGYPQCSKKWPNGICAVAPFVTLLRARACYELRWKTA